MTTTQRDSNDVDAYEGATSTTRSSRTLRCPSCRALLRASAWPGAPIACPACACDCRVPALGDATPMHLSPPTKLAIGAVALVATIVGLVLSWRSEAGPIVALLGSILSVLALIPVAMVLSAIPSYPTPILRALDRVRE